MPSLTKTATFSLQRETMAQHIVNLIQEDIETNSWNDDLNGIVTVLEELSMETAYIIDVTHIFVYMRGNDYGDLALGGSHKTSDPGLSVDVQSMDVDDFKEIVVKLEELFFANNSTAVDVKSGRNERRWRIILNNSLNLSNKESRMFRQVIDIKVKNYIER